MSSRYHAVIWIDHLIAKVFFVGLSGVDEIVLHSHLTTHHLHHKANTIGSGHVGEDFEFFRRVADAVSSSGEILILGPAGEKTTLTAYLQENRPDIARNVVRVEPSDHPTDAEIVARAKRFFNFAR